MNRHERRAADSGKKKDKSQFSTAVESTKFMIQTFQDALDKVEERMTNLEEYVEEKLEPKPCTETKEMDL